MANNVAVKVEIKIFLLKLVVQRLFDSFESRTRKVDNTP